MSKNNFYQDLSAGEIRVLELQPANHERDPLKCKIHHVDLEKAHYAALSYSWGAGTESLKSTFQIKYKRTLRAKIFRHDDLKEFIRINSNLARALACLRRKDRSINLWTDMICINQQNETEKPKQIEMMRDIYARATVVHAWLGPSSDEGDRVEHKNTINNIHTSFELASGAWALARKLQVRRRPSSESEWLQTCFAVASDDPHKQEKFQGHQTRSAEVAYEFEEENAASQWAEYSQALLTAVKSDTEFMRKLAVFQDLSNLKWFSRIWILQEYGRARSLTFHYGSAQSDHLPIFLALSLADSLRHADVAQHKLPNLDRRFLACLTARTTCTQQISVEEVLQAAFNSPPPTHNATDPRDLINARLGLANDRISYPRHITQYYSPAKKSTKLNASRVFASIAKHLLSNGFVDLLIIFKPYDFLRGAPDHLLADDAASWLQDLAEGWAVPSWTYEWSKDGLHTFARYDACDGTLPRVSFVRCPSAIFGEALVMSGVRIGTVQDQSRRFSEYVIEAELGVGAVAHSDLHTDIEPLSDNEEAKLRTKLEALHRKHSIEVSEADVELLFSVDGFPAARFWYWWIAWVTELQRLSTSRNSQRPNIAELLFREASAKLQRNMGVVEKVIGTDGDLARLLDLSLWSELLLSDDARMKAVGVELAETFFRSAWGMRVAILDTGRLCYVPEDTSKEDKVVIFHGVKAPLVLHIESSSSTHSIVGPAHVAGAMEGDLIRDSQSTEEYTII